MVSNVSKPYFCIANQIEKECCVFCAIYSNYIFLDGLRLYLGNANDFILANKIAVLLPLGGSSFLLILVTGIIGGIAAGISAVFGKQVASILKS